MFLRKNKQSSFGKVGEKRKLKKIAIVSEFCVPYLYGGGEFRYYFLIKELQKLGYDVHWLCMKLKNEHGAVKNKEIIDGIKVIHLGPTIKNIPFRSLFNFIHYSWSLFWHLIFNKYDLIDAQAFIPLIPSWLASRLTNTKMVATIHDVSKGKDNQWLQFGNVASFFEKLIYKMPYPNIITVSDSIRDALIKRFKVNKKRLNIVYNAVDLELIDSIEPKFNPLHSYTKKNNSVSFVGRLATNKRVKDLILAVDKLRYEIKDINLTIMGRGPEEKFLRELVKKQKLEKHVKFLIGVSDEEKFSQLKKSQVFVLPSVREGFGIVLIEAMACQNAVIGAKVEGIINVINDDVDGLFFEAKNVEDLAEKIKSLLLDDNLRNKLSLEGRKKVENNFCWDKKAKEIVEIYNI
jgi:L-malate glycosyltransferase